MLKHRASLIGYLLYAIFVPISVLGSGIQPVWDDPSGGRIVMAATFGISFGSILIIGGILARGFERVEAAILSRKDP